MPFRNRTILKLVFMALTFGRIVQRHWLTGRGVALVDELVEEVSMIHEWLGMMLMSP